MGKGFTGSERTTALLDTGSDRSYCAKGLVERLRIRGKPTSLFINTLTQGEQCNTTEVDLEVRGINTRRAKCPISLPKVLVLDRLPPSLENSTATALDIDAWGHLRGLAPLPPNRRVAELLIGQDCPDALTPLECRTGPDGAPFAIRTRLGWTINGPLMGNLTHRFTTECSMLTASTEKTRLEEQVRRFWEIEALHQTPGDGSPSSVEDKRVIKLCSSTGQRVQGQYQFPIPFRRQPPCLPDNRALAERRLLGLKKRLSRDTRLRRRYKEEMKKLFNEGFAERVPRRQLSKSGGNRWYLPHHPVLNPNKPDKVRIVFDYAAAFTKTSLNNQELQGPDLNNKLIGVLMRFRQEPIALMADIEAMFHQVKVNPEHRDTLRFLWWEGGDLTQTPMTCRMTVHLFGGVWSPSCAAYALQRTFQDFGDGFSDAANRAKSNFYVDDLLLSVTEPKEAIMISRQLRHLLSLGGFKLTKWINNDKEVLNTIPLESRHAGVKEVTLGCEDLPTERALGVMWDLTGDQFAAKLIFQDECRRKKDWDEDITKQNLLKWLRWLEDLKSLRNFKVPRCYRPGGLGCATSSQLHHFCDASQVAYAVVTYLRTVDNEGNAICSFVCGKARLAPLKQLTVPRLELCAAVLATRVDQTIKREIGVPLEKSVFWTDSMIVIMYISNLEKRFHTFVANRISAIHVRSRWNPTEDAIRGIPVEDMLKECRWIDGSFFLSLPEKYWPIKPEIRHELENDPEVKLEAVSLATAGNNADAIMKLLWNRYSSWHALQRGVSWIRRVSSILRHDFQGATSKPLELPELRNSKWAIIRFLQQEAYAREAHAVGAGHSGREHTLSILRCEFWIARCRPLLDKIIKECATCRRNNWKPTRQREAMLPEDRTKPGERPFTYKGTDCFGPFTVRQGRKSTKRYGCIFTCLATRAMHLEVLESLDTDALLNTTVLFIARKGTTPKRIRSDNGANMVGACKELRAAVRSWRNDERINRHFQKKDIEWVFNPPAASHMEGVWERQIRTVRKVLRAIVGTQVLDEYRL
ncbi:uncharacterized protein LOC121873053 [Homarus americanus]|uniref:uncharacterized protein LOC121873053 n=1 Tax=Homarus americanus TaxID=6706 RepID=UPI001C44589F|nr:uncharacterized protein LOC121873053 [Homarus americanus]